MSRGIPRKPLVCRVKKCGFYPIVGVREGLKSRSSFRYGH